MNKDDFSPDLPPLMKNTRTTNSVFAAAALAGLLSGGALTTSAQGAVNPANAEGKNALAGVRADDKKTEKGETHGCAGKNSCKGKGGCKSGDNGCAGKNSCKGKGGCAVKDGKAVHVK
jgi:hypothetical protein